ncbi:hypothetical protein SAMN04515671_0086 [Nakamurella panacisegetis]|uniref:Uncharacterized protein n=1 Tax=Nakamurella panacisegetis TaxID=1090615 RepID=A0A1H0HIV9_9ACTN|nr:hypothetical protein [Nakamurella panacisegetis]SDO18973.1 hypothetical protein SAMN04515671_0086 [Nakamurella panacisegetis]
MPDNSAARKVAIDSIFGGGEVVVDPWSINLVADDFAASNPWTSAQALAEAPAPKMFSGGTADTPPFTASGIDPQFLLQMPAYTRHALAAEPERAAVALAFEQDSTNPYALYSHQGLTDAIARIRTWAAGQAFDPLQAMREQEDQKAAAARRNAALATAFARGGKAASDALMAQYAAEDATRTQQQAAAFASVMDALGWQDTGTGNIVPKR